MCKVNSARVRVEAFFSMSHVLGAIWGSLSCPRALTVQVRNRITKPGRPILPTEPQPPLSLLYCTAHS